MVQGILVDSTKYNLLLGDGVNINDVPFQETFPYVGWAQSGYTARHVDPGEPGCTGMQADLSGELDCGADARGFGPFGAANVGQPS